MKMKNKIKNTANKILLGLMLAMATQAAWAVETVTYYHNDALGSPVAATDSNGAILWKEDYHPYGSRIRKQNSDTNQAWYTGKHHESDIDLSYFGARWYDPNIGRFMAIDPVGFKEGNIHSHNRYAYANNNPYLFIDPDGRESVGAVEERLRTGNTLRHPAGGSSSSYPATMSPVPGFSPPMSSAELGITAGSAATGVGAIRQSIKWGIGRFGAKGASEAATTLTKEGEVFIRVGAHPKNLKMTVDGKTGTLPGTYAFPKSTFDKIGRDPTKLKDFGDLPGAAPQYYRELRPPAGTPIQRGTVPGGQFGGRGGVSEALFPKGF